MTYRGGVNKMGHQAVKAYLVGDVLEDSIVVAA